MRLALLTLALLATGCAKKPAGAAPAPAAPLPDEVKDRWQLVKVELPTDGGVCVEDYTGLGTDVAFVKLATKPPEPIPFDKIPPTPAEFSHQHHAAEMGIDCRYCHTPAEKPVVLTAEGRLKGCMNCHQQFATAATGLRGKRWFFAATRDETKMPKEIDLTECDADGRPLAAGRRRGVYEEKGDELRIALVFGDAPKDFRPKEFKTMLLKPGDSIFVGVAVFHLKK